MLYVTPSGLTAPRCAFPCHSYDEKKSTSMLPEGCITENVQYSTRDFLVWYWTVSVANKRGSDAHHPSPCSSLRNRPQ
jgi:hypothetical protein